MSRVRRVAERGFFKLVRRLVKPEDPWIRRKIESAKNHLDQQIAKQKRKMYRPTRVHQQRS